jgi:hypothetical protein
MKNMPYLAVMYIFVLVVPVVPVVPVVSEDKIVFPAIRDFALAENNDGVLITWNIEDVEGFEKNITIQRGSSENDLVVIGLTKNNSFVDYYVNIGNQYSYKIAVNYNKQDRVERTSSNYNATSKVLVCNPVKSGRGELQKVIDIVVLDGDNKVILSWTDKYSSIDKDYIKVYQVYRYDGIPSNYRFRSYTSFGDVSSPFTDNHFDPSNKSKDMYFYAISIVLKTIDSKIRYIGPQSDCVSATPNL